MAVESEPPTTNKKSYRYFTEDEKDAKKVQSSRDICELCKRQQNRGIVIKRGRAIFRMTELQTTVEFSVELYKFYNVDLFQRGYYQIRTSFRMSPRYTSKIEVSLSNGNTAERNGITSSQVVFPSCVVTGTAVSKTFQILYRNEEVALDDVILFRVHLIVDSRKIEDSLLKADFQMIVELWFTEQPFGPDHHNSIQCVSARSMKLHLCPLKGLHHHLPVLFDYFHLSAVTLTVHGCLLAIHQPYMNVSKPGKPAWLTNSPKVGNRFQASTSLESVLFGNVQGMKSSPSLTRLNQARCIHQSICTILLSSHESLQSKLIEYMKLLPPWQQLQIEVTDCCAKLKKLKELSKNVDAEDELLAVVNSDIAQLCAENIILWQQFLECFTLKDRIQQHLTREHHLQRVKRFAEGFFVVENARQAIFHCAEQSYQTYLSISDSIRKTKYFSSLPSLAVECPDLDGNAETLPVIFEDHYQDISHRKDSSKMTPSAISVHDIGFDVTSNDEGAAAAAALHKKVTNSDTELCKVDKNRRKPKFQDVKQMKTIGCFSTGIMPKSSMSSEDLYYVDNGTIKKEVNQSYKRKVASLPRGCSSVEEKCSNKNDLKNESNHNCSVGPKTSVSVEHITPFRETSVDRFSFDGRYFRITSSAAVPKYIQAKRKEAFRTSGGSKSLSAVEQCSRTLPKYHRSNAVIPRLETVPLFTQISSEMDTLSCKQPLATSNSMDLGVSSKSSFNGGSVVCGHWTQRSNHQWVSHLRTKIPNKAANTKLVLEAEQSRADGQKVSSNRISASSSSSFSTKDNSNETKKTSDPLKGPDCFNDDVKLDKNGTVNVMKADKNDAMRDAKADINDVVMNQNHAPVVTCESTIVCVPEHDCKEQKSDVPATNDVNYLKQKLKETLKLELNPVNYTAARKTQPTKDRRVENKVRKRFNGGMQLMQTMKNHSSACSTSSDSIIVLTGYKKLEQSESLPVGLADIGNPLETTKCRDDSKMSPKCCESEHIPEEDTEDDLIVKLDFKRRSQQLRKTKVTRSMPNVAIFSTGLKKDVSIVTSESMPDLGSETTTEVDDLSSVSVARNAPSNNHHSDVGNTRWSFSDSSARAARLPKSTVKDSDTEVDENVTITPKVQPSENVMATMENKKPAAVKETTIQNKKNKKKKRQQLRTPIRNIKEGTKKMAWLRHRRSSSSTYSSSSSTSERSGWVSSQCSSLDASSSDIARESRDSSPRLTSSAVRPPRPSNNPDKTRTKKQKRRKGLEVKKASVSPSMAEDDKHIYEEIHLPPEEFRDPTPSAFVLQPPSPFTNCTRDSRSRDSRSDGHHHVKGDQGRGQKQSKILEINKSLDVPAVHRSRPRPHLARSHAVRHQQNHYKDRLEVREEKPARSDLSSINKRYREPVTAEYLDTKCTILEMFTDTTFCGYAGNVKNWSSPTPENGQGTVTGGDDGGDSDDDSDNDDEDDDDDDDDDDEDDDDDHARVPAAPPPPRTRTPSVPKINDSVDITSSTTATGTEEELTRPDDTSTSPGTLVSVVGDNTINFVKAKEDFKKQLSLPAFLYSDYPLLASNIPYFHVSEDFRLSCTEGLHLVVCVHGLDGNSADLRLVKTYLELGLPCSNLEFLMSERNQGDTFSDFEKMTEKLVAEILYHIEAYRLSPEKISFIGHSLGNIIIRSALARPQMKPWLGRLHTFLSLSGPHLGTLYNSSGLVNMGLWFMQKWKKSGSLLQLSMKDAADIRRTFLYRLSQKPGLEHFKNILLFGSSQDRYVPIHSARIELCKASLRDTSVQGMAYRDMVHGLLQPVARNPNITFVRYDVHHALPNTANSLIGRAAHIAVLDSELFIEKFLTVCGLKYFK